jgi:predicted ATP-dependent endonuclease of OLD family
MELVYLWVEDYKNIKKQGFNFSPRFKCEFKDEYDENGKLRDNCELIIDEKKDYVSIIPTGINITAIVGENGSGKSNILEVLSDYYFDNNTVIKVFYDNSEILYKINNIVKINSEYKELDVKETTVLYTEIPSENALNNNNIRNISLWNNFQKNEYSIYDNLNIIKNKMQTSHMILMKKYDFLPGVNKKPKYIEFSFNHYYFDNIEHDNINQIWINIFRILVIRDFSKHKQGNDIDEYLNYDYEYLSIKEVREFIKDNIDEDTTLNWLNELQSLSNEFIKYYKVILNSKVEYIEQITPKSKYEDEDEYEEDRNYKIKTFKLFIKFEDFTENFLISIENLFSYSREELIINLKWDITLSTGEESFLNLFASLYNCIKTYSYTFEHINIIIDEIEAYLHPNWQTQFIDLLIKFFNLNGMRYNSKTNIILTSHSPFILSDLPKENVIFLEKGEQVYPFENKQTFGANIHTLLSHGFFMKDGLMGEFAKDKIQSILKYHEEILEKELTTEENINQRDEEKEIYEKEHKTKFRQIQSIIGDDYLKQVIKNHLVEIEKILYDEYLIDKEIEKLQDEIDRLNRLKK